MLDRPRYGRHYEVGFVSLKPMTTKSLEFNRQKDLPNLLHRPVEFKAHSSHSNLS